MLYLVVVEDGSYSDYISWIAYGGMIKEEAETVAKTLTDTCDAYNIASRIYWDKYCAKFKARGIRCDDIDYLEQCARIKVEIGPEPAFVGGRDRTYSVVEVKENTIGKFWT